MPNYSSMFSAQIPYASPAQRQWLLDQFESASDSDEGAMCQYADEPHNHAIWVHADECGDVERLAELVAQFQTHFTLTTPFTFTWANTCSRPILDGFSGGGVAIYRGKTKFCCPDLVLSHWLTQQQARAKRPHPQTT